jgi:hypothetical protein
VVRGPFGQNTRIPKESACFFTKSPNKHWSLRQGTEKGTEKSLSLESVSPKLTTENWSVYEYPPNAKRKYKPRVALTRFRKVDVALTSRDLAKGSKDPITLALKEVVTIRRSADPRRSFNGELRQISCTYWKDLIIPEAQLVFYPARWKLPEAPKGLEELLERAEKPAEAKR